MRASMIPAKEMAILKFYISCRCHRFICIYRNSYVYTQKYKGETKLIQRDTSYTIRVMDQLERQE